MTDLAVVLQELRRGLEAIYGPRLLGLYLYGSYARGEAQEGSDIDVAMVLDDYDSIGAELTRTLDVVADLSLEHNCVISIMPLKIAEWELDAEPLVMNVRREGQAVA